MLSGAAGGGVTAYRLIGSKAFPVDTYLGFLGERFLVSGRLFFIGKRVTRSVP